MSERNTPTRNRAVIEGWLESNRARPQARAMRSAGYSAVRVSKRVGRSLPGPAPRSSLSRIRRDWADHAGRFARLSRPVRLQGTREGTVLVVEALGSAGALVQADSARILDSINARSGAGTVSGLRVVQGRVERARPIDAPPPGLTPSEEASLRRDLAAAPEGPLKAALESLGRAVTQKTKQQDRS